MSISQLEFRSFERRRRYLLGPSYKHSTPNGVKPVLPVTGSIKTPGECAFSPNLAQKTRTYEIATQSIAEVAQRAEL